MNIVGIIIFVCFCLNILLLLAMIFIERKKPQAIISWLFILTFFPLIGFLFYVLFGSGLSFKTRRMLKKRNIYAHDYMQFVEDPGRLYDENLKRELEKDTELIAFNMSSKSLLCPYNDVKIFLDGKSKMEALLTDLENAKHSINIEYYIFASDKTGKAVMDVLCKKAKEGVKVKLIYDSVGSLRAKRRFFRRLRKAGGEVKEYFPPFMYIRLINFKMNYRNHKKIVVIDGKIGYTGGINIRDDHMGAIKKLSPWRDTHIRIEGSGVYALTNAFFNDYRYVAKDSTEPKELVHQGYFPRTRKMGKVALQVVTSGPDSKDQNIKDMFVRLILNAKKRVWIQSPYFVPDEVFMSALKIAKKSGVDVKIMLPLKPDKKFVYMVSMSFAKDIVEEGIDVYLYNGFLHSKAILIDDDKLSIGTCNMDNRSFALNFELTTMLYGKELNKQYEVAFLDDVSKSMKVDKAYFREHPLINKMGQAVFRLLSPLL